MFFVGNISKLTKNNKAYRRVIHTGPNAQLVLMSLKPGEEIGYEIHDNTDQFIRIETGTGISVIGLTADEEQVNEYDIQSGSAVAIPAGMWHNIINTGNKPLKLYTVYSPPEHPFDRLQTLKSK